MLCIIFTLQRLFAFLFSPQMIKLLQTLSILKLHFPSLAKPDATGAGGALAVHDLHPHLLLPPGLLLLDVLRGLLPLPPGQYPFWHITSLWVLLTTTIHCRVV